MRAQPSAGTGSRTGRRRAAALILPAVAALLALTGCTVSGGSPAAQTSYGGLPSFLPAPSYTSDSVLTGTADRPALTTEGDTVQVRLDGTSVRAMVAGPVVPGEGLPYQAESTTCTWTVTLTGANTPVPITVGDFTGLDHLGAVYHPALVPGRPRPPATLAPGRSVTFELRSVMAVGEGVLRWAPGGRIVASWDFVVEND